MVYVKGERDCTCSLHICMAMAHPDLKIQKWPLPDIRTGVYVHSASSQQSLSSNCQKPSLVTKSLALSPSLPLSLSPKDHTGKEFENKLLLIAIPVRNSKARTFAILTKNFALRTCGKDRHTFAILTRNFALRLSGKGRHRSAMQHWRHDKEFRLTVYVVRVVTVLHCAANYIINTPNCTLHNVIWEMF